MITILGTLFKFLKERIADDAELQVFTLFKLGKLQGRKAFDDWSRKDDFEFFVSKWLSAMAGQTVNLVVESSNRDIPHRRRLDLEFNDGRSLTVRFDQGIAYWQVRFRSRTDMLFDFDLEARDQVMHMAKVVEAAQVQNSEQKWSTDVLVEFKG